MSNENKKKKSPKKNKTKERAFTIGFMFVITVIFISLLSAVNLFTKDTIEFNKKISLIRAVLYSSGIEIPKSQDKVKIETEKDSEGKELDNYTITKLDENKKAVESYSIEAVRKHKASSDTPELLYYKVLTGDTLNAYVFMPEGAGLWGEIVALIGFDKELTKITGIEFVEQNETPGLGARITETWFKEQFIGKYGPKEFSRNDDKLFTHIPEPKDKSNLNQDTQNRDKFHAITGATVTSNAIKRIVNDTIKKARKILLSKENKEDN